MLASVAAPLVLAAAPAAAQMQGPETAPGAQRGLIQAVMAKRAEIQEINQQLALIRETAIEENPALAAEQEAFAEKVEAEMADAGLEPQQRRETLESIVSRLQDEALPQQERQRLAQEYRQEVSELQQAQAQLMGENDALRAEQAALGEKLREAMQAEDPQTETLIAQLQSAQQEYRELAGQIRPR
jgi:regulator of replication initiation timing